VIGIPRAYGAERWLDNQWIVALLITFDRGENLEAFRICHAGLGRAMHYEGGEIIEAVGHATFGVVHGNHAVPVSSRRHTQSRQAHRVDAGNPADLDEHHREVIAVRAPDNDSGSAQVDRVLGDVPGRVTARTGRDRSGHLRAEHLDERARDCIAIQRVH
jgi:hypothetical protein